MLNWVDEPCVSDLAEDVDNLLLGGVVGCLNEYFVGGEPDEGEVDEVVEAEGVTLG